LDANAVTLDPGATPRRSPASTRRGSDPVRYQGPGGSRLPLIVLILVAIAAVALVYFLFIAPR